MWCFQTAVAWPGLNLQAQVLYSLQPEQVSEQEIVEGWLICLRKRCHCSVTYLMTVRLVYKLAAFSK